MVMVPDAAKMHFRHSDQQNSSGEDPDPPHGLRNFGARWVGLHTTWSAPKPKILATPLTTCAKSTYFFTLITAAPVSVTKPQSTTKEMYTCTLY